MRAQDNRDDSLFDEALAWHQALEQDDADWDGYLIWLETDPRHRAAFDQVALVDATVGRHRETLGVLLVDRDVPTARRYRFPNRWLVGAVAASLALVVGVPALLRPEAIATYQTGKAESRTIALPGGANVTLAPSSRMVVTGTSGRQIALSSGEAYFDVRHDPDRLLAIEAGGYRVSDIGTRFAISLSPAGLRVGVSEGHVGVSQGDAGSAVKVAAGHQLIAANGAATLSDIDNRDIGSWRAGRLVYADAPLSLVAADLSRYAGAPVTVDADIAMRHFSGVLAIRDGSRLINDLSALAGLRVERLHTGAHLHAP